MLYVRLVVDKSSDLHFIVILSNKQVNGKIEKKNRQSLNDFDLMSNWKIISRAKCH